jgi:hypothetical protein
MNNNPFANPDALFLRPKNVKELILYHHHMLDNCLPEELSIVTFNRYRPDRILRKIDKLQKELDTLENVSLEKLAKEYIQEYYADPEKYNQNEGCIYVEVRKNECEAMVNQLKEWNPETEAGKTMRENVIDHLNMLFKNNISEPWAMHRYCTVLSKTIEYKGKRIDLVTEINHLKKIYPLALAYVAEREKLEADLFTDMESLK